MMRIVVLICETIAAQTCTEVAHDFTPPIPVACIHAAGPELDRLTPEGWAVDRWRCADPDVPRGFVAAGGSREN
jgi:hypothetical protein